MDDEEDHTSQRIFPRNPATIIESDEDDDVLVTFKSKGTNISETTSKPKGTKNIALKFF